ncbi:MAG: ECF transporter S component [Butyrivibrio sp.]|nr:ECF transporter S component [Butyrivibrio sp.]
MNKKVLTTRIAVTAMMLALCIVSQIFKNLSVYITGPIINACLIITTLLGGGVCGSILAVITPVTAYFISGSPIISVIPAIMPCIMGGNLILVWATAVFFGKIRKNYGVIIGITVGSVLKALFMGGVISLILIPNLLPAKMLPKKAVFQFTFSGVQLITAAIGSFFAFNIWLVVKKVFAGGNVCEK